MANGFELKKHDAYIKKDKLEKFDFRRVVGRKLVSFNSWVNTRAEYPIPEGYTLLEYLESTGSQYIETGITATKTTEFELGAYYPSPVSGSQCIFGMRIGYNKPTKQEQWRMMITTHQDATVSWKGGYASFGNHQMVQSTESGISDYVFSYKDGVFSNGNNVTQAVDISNSVVPTDDGEIPSDWTLWLFKGHYINDSVAGNPASGRIYYCKLWQDKKLVRDLVPVLDDKGTTCMFDKVSGETLYNKGSGKFKYNAVG